jgi:ubiquinol oxidase
MKGKAVAMPTLPTPTLPRLTHDELVAAQQETLQSPRRKYGMLARILFATLDLFYGHERTLAKFKVLELIARVPYQAWEQTAYIAITQVNQRVGLARRIYDRVIETRSQQDNEQWHLLIIDELLEKRSGLGGHIWYFWIPQLIAFVYYHLSWFLYVVRPRLSYSLNADFEDHAEHEYAHLVGEHPEWEHEAFETDFAADYGTFDSLADLLRQIGHDERLHKEESETWLSSPRFQ